MNFGHHIQRFKHLTLCTELLLERTCMGTVGSTSIEKALYLMILLNLIVSNINMLSTGNTENKRTRFIFANKAIASLEQNYGRR